MRSIVTYALFPPKPFKGSLLRALLHEPKVLLLDEPTRSFVILRQGKIVEVATLSALEATYRSDSLEEIFLKSTGNPPDDTEGIPAE